MAAIVDAEAVSTRMDATNSYLDATLQELIDAKKRLDAEIASFDTRRN